MKQVVAPHKPAKLYWGVRSDIGANELQKSDFPGTGHGSGSEPLTWWKKPPWLMIRSQGCI